MKRTVTIVLLIGVVQAFAVAAPEGQRAWFGKTTKAAWPKGTTCS